MAACPMVRVVQGIDQALYGISLMIVNFIADTLEWAWATQKPHLE